jgi:predicted nuclease of predicted toxin-antitoxin system
LKFLVDASCDARIATHLNSNGHDATRVGTDYQADLPDTEVLAIAARDGRIRITEDRDFGELVFRLRHRHAGVIFLRLETTNIRTRCDRLDRALEDLGDSIEEFVVVSIDGIRIRRP